MDHVPRLTRALVCALVCVPAVSLGQSVCYQYQFAGGAWFDTPVAAVQAKVSACNVSDEARETCALEDNTCTGSQGFYTGCIVQMHNAPAITAAPSVSAGPYLRLKKVTTAAHPAGAGLDVYTNITGGIGNRVNPEGCPPPEQCSNNPADGVGDVFTSLHYPGADGYCNPVSKCRMSVTSSVAVDGSTIYTVRHTSQQCMTGQQPGPGPDDLTDGENCVNGSGGEFCLSNMGENCGFLNDAFVCLPKIEQDGCEVFADGGRVCGPQAPTPPAPDSGAPGQPAPPDEQIALTQNNVTTTYNYFNANTVANSARPAGSSGDNPYDGQDDGNGGGSCQGEECGEGQGEASGGESCDVPPSCSGDPIQCAQLKQQWLERCPASVTDAQVDAVLGDNAQIGNEEHDMTTSLSQSLVVGGNTACPAPPEIALPGGGHVTITVITKFCELAAMISSLVMMAAYVAASFIVAGRV